MAQRRDFIQEIIDTLKNQSARIEQLYTELREGNRTVEQFEQEYTSIMYSLKEDADNEAYTPNNHCSYVKFDGTEIPNPKTQHF